jgi:uncharacterized membrane protein YsdA (DUF1294 family)
MRPLLLAGPRM